MPTRHYVEVPTATGWTFRVGAASAEYMRTSMAGAGALITGRRLFDITGGWGGAHPVGVPVIVVTSRPVADWPHRDTFTFVGDVQAAVAAAKDAAAGKDVVIASASIARQALDAGLLDGIHVDLVPVLLGAGIPWFDNLAKAPLGLGAPVVVEGNGVTHLAYQVLTAQG